MWDCEKNIVDKRTEDEEVELKKCSCRSSMDG